MKIPAYPTSPRLARAAFAAALLACAGSAQAAFVLVSDFDALGSGGLTGQGGWTANQVTFAVAADPTESGNQVLSIRRDSGVEGNAYLNLGGQSLGIAEGATGTLFLRLNLTATPNTTTQTKANGISFGVGNASSFSDFNSFRSQALSQYDANNAGEAVLLGRAGGSNTTLSSDLVQDTWYSVWMVVDNAADSTSVYIQGGSFTAQTLLGSYAFRSASAAALDGLYFAHGTQFRGELLFDDVYVDNTGASLLNPAAIPEPSSAAALLGLAVVAAAGLRRRRRA